MKKFQKFGYMALGAIFMFVLMVAIPAVTASTQRQLTAHFNNIRVVVNGALITPRDGLGNVVEPFIVDGTTYLPVRAIAEAFGEQVHWDGATQTVYIGTRPGTTQFLTDVAPAFQTSLGAARPIPDGRFYEFSALRTGGADGFNMGGTRFVDGIRFQNNDTWAAFNLNSQFTNLSGVVGQIDGTFFDGLDRATIRFFADGRMILEVPIIDGMLPQPFSIDLTGVNQLRIETSDQWSSFTAGVGNPVIR